MKCENIRLLLTSYLVGEPDPAMKKTVDEHLETCCDCRASLQKIRSTLDLVQGALAATQKAQPRLAPEKRQRVLSTRPPEPVSWLTRHRPMVSRVAAVLVVAFLLVSVVGWQLNKVIRESFEQFGGQAPSTVRFIWDTVRGQGPMFRMGELACRETAPACVAVNEPTDGDGNEFMSLPEPAAKPRGDSRLDEITKAKEGRKKAEDQFFNDARESLLRSMDEKNSQPTAIVPPSEVFEMPGDSTESAGVGGGTAAHGIGSGSEGDDVSFEMASVKSPLVMKGLYAARRAGGAGSHETGASEDLKKESVTKPGTSERARRDDSDNVTGEKSAKDHSRKTGDENGRGTGDWTVDSFVRPNGGDADKTPQEPTKWSGQATPPAASQDARGASDPGWFAKKKDAAAAYQDARRNYDREAILKETRLSRIDRTLAENKELQKQAEQKISDIKARLEEYKEDPVTETPPQPREMVPLNITLPKPVYMGTPVAIGGQIAQPPTPVPERTEKADGRVVMNGKGPVAREPVSGPAKRAIPGGEAGGGERERRQAGNELNSTTIGGYDSYRTDDGKVPILGDVPTLGRLFVSEAKEVAVTDGLVVSGLPIGSSTAYRIQPGDTLSVIAKKYNTTTEALQALNNIRNPNSIKAGSTLLVSASPDISASIAQPPVNKVEQTGPVFKAVGQNPFVVARANPFSTFAMDVDTASYTVARNYMMKGFLPPAESVRTEEFVNFFDYAYKPPTDKLFAIYTDCAPTPFARGLHLLKIGVEGKRLARDAKKRAVLTCVIDTSGSMSEPDRLPLIQRSVRLLIDQLDPADSVAIVQYDSHARLVLDRTPVAQKKAILAALDGLQTSGSTNLEEGMREGYRLAAKRFVPGAINRVLILSDGAANLGSVDAPQILGAVEAFRKQGIYCSVFGFGMGTYNDEMLKALASKGDGTYAFIDSMDEARRVFVDKLTGTLNVIAADAKIQVEFNPDRVKRYRQIGYEERQLTKEQFRDDSVDAGEVGAGQSVTALYELELDGRQDGRIGVVRIRYKNTETGKVEEFEKAVTQADICRTFESTDTRFKLAAGVAEFAELLRGSDYAKGSRYSDVAGVLRPVALELNLDYRLQELLRMVQGASSMPRAAVK